MAWACSKLSAADGDLLEAIADAATLNLGEATSAELANLFWAFAKLVVSREPFLGEISSCAAARAGEFHGQSCSNVMWAMARFHLQDERLRDAVAARSLALMAERACNPQDLTNTAWALAVSRWHHEPLLGALQAASRATVTEFGPQDISNSAWAYAKLERCDAVLMESIAAASVRRLADGDPQHWANTAWALATLQVRHQPFLEAMSLRSRATMREFGPQEVANVAWSVARLMFVDVPLLQALTSKAMTALRSGNIQNITNTLWAMAQIKFKNQTLFNTLAQEAARTIADFRPRDLSITAWSYARCEVRDDTLMDAIAAAALARQGEFRGRPQELSNLAWSLSLLDIRHRPLLSALSEAAMATHPEEFSMQELANVQWSFAALRYCDPPLIASLSSSFASRLRRASGGPPLAEEPLRTQNIVNTAWALDSLGALQPGAEELFGQIIGAFQERCAGTWAFEWVTLASTAEKQGFAAAVPEFMGAFASRALDPARRFLERLRAAPDDGASAAVERELQEWVDRVQLPHLGAAHTPAALRAAGVVPVGPGAAWVECARHAVLRTAWWSCPHAAVSSQGVVAWWSADVRLPGGGRVEEPGSVALADDSGAHPLLVERMLVPLFLQVPRDGHAERRALIAVLRAVCRAAGAEGAASWREAGGVVRLYASHHPCVSCLAVLAQFSRRLPGVEVQVAFDDAWAAWSERPPPAPSAPSASGLPRALSVGRAA